MTVIKEGYGYYLFLVNDIYQVHILSEDDDYVYSHNLDMLNQQDVDLAWNSFVNAFE